MKPSLKNKLSADKIEEANRMLNESKAPIEVAKPVIEPAKRLETVLLIHSASGLLLRFCLPTTYF